MRPNGWTDGPTVVVIDDEESIREGCRQTLEAEGYRTCVAPDGRTGLRLVERTRPSVVLVDLRMPGMDGMEVLERIHSMDRNVVSIVMTGYGSVDSAIQALRLGAQDYLQKPVSPEQVADAVNKALPHAEPAVEEPVAATPEVDLEEAFLIKLILRKAARNKEFGRKLLYLGRQELMGWGLSPEARNAILSGDLAWLMQRCGTLSDEERTWLQTRPW